LKQHRTSIPAHILWSLCHNQCMIAAKQISKQDNTVNGRKSVPSKLYPGSSYNQANHLQIHFTMSSTSSSIKHSGNCMVPEPTNCHTLEMLLCFLNAPSQTLTGSMHKQDSYRPTSYYHL
jgi:hypothetical protein